MTFYKKELKDNSGQSLVEILIALGVGAILIGAASASIAVTLQSNFQTRKVQVAGSLGEESVSNVRTLAESDWHTIYNLSKSSSNHYYFSSSTRAIVSGDETVTVANGTFTRYFYIDNVNRDSNGNISVSGIDDPSTQQMTTVVSWQSGSGSVNRVEYLTRYFNKIFDQTNWQSGPGQDNFATTNNISVVNDQFATSTNIDYTSSTGSIIIKGF